MLKVCTALPRIRRSTPSDATTAELRTLDSLGLKHAVVNAVLAAHHVARHSPAPKPTWQSRRTWKVTIDPARGIYGRAGVPAAKVVIGSNGWVYQQNDNGAYEPFGVDKIFGLKPGALRELLTNLRS